MDKLTRLFDRTPWRSYDRYEAIKLTDADRATRASWSTLRSEPVPAPPAPRPGARDPALKRREHPRGRRQGAPAVATLRQYDRLLGSMGVGRGQAGDGRAHQLSALDTRAVPR